MWRALDGACVCFNSFYLGRISDVGNEDPSSTFPVATLLLKPFFARHLHFELGYFQLKMLNSLFQLFYIFDDTFGCFWHFLFPPFILFLFDHGKSLSIMSSGYAYVLWSAMSNPNSSASLCALSSPALLIAQNRTKPVPPAHAMIDSAPIPCIPI